MIVDVIPLDGTAYFTHEEQVCSPALSGRALYLQQACSRQLHLGLSIKQRFSNCGARHTPGDAVGPLGGGGEFIV